MENITIGESKKGGCGCGCSTEGQVAELDVTLIPKLIRHAAVIGGAGGLKPGQAFVIAVPHDPLPLLKQIDRQFGEEIRATYLTEGPEVWRVELARV